MPLPERQALLRRGRLLEYATVGYNVLEGIVAIGSGLLAGSVARVGFGIDSGIEVLSGLILLWRLNAGRDAHDRERVEARALKLVGASFLLLAAYVAYDAIGSLVGREAPDASFVGMALAAGSAIAAVSWPIAWQITLLLGWLGLYAVLYASITRLIRATADEA